MATDDIRNDDEFIIEGEEPERSDVPDTDDGLETVRELIEELKAALEDGGEGGSPVDTDHIMDGMDGIRRILTAHVMDDMVMRLAMKYGRCENDTCCLTKEAARCIVAEAMADSVDAFVHAVEENDDVEMSRASRMAFEHQADTIKDSLMSVCGDDGE